MRFLAVVLLVACSGGEVPDRPAGTLGFDAKACVKGQVQHRYYLDGSQAIDVIGIEGDDCAYHHMHEVGGTAHYETCRVPRAAGVVWIETGKVPGKAPGTCVLDNINGLSPTPPK